jgi:acyl carrier protein phosphodiesterase
MLWTLFLVPCALFLGFWTLFLGHWTLPPGPYFCLMNYLAHAYLSFSQPEILVGNMISDFIKGKKKFDYAENIQKGITLHRAIDEFTDNHKATHEAKTFFKPVYGLYAGAFMDVVYDHFLARDIHEFPGNELSSFAQKTYGQLASFEPVFPERFQRMFFYMRTQNWLFHYQFKEGIKNSFAGLVRRAAYMDESQSAFAVFEENYESLQEYYDAFFPDIKKFAASKLKDLEEGIS